MTVRRPRKVLWSALARGIPLASIVVLAACSSGMPREEVRNSAADGKAITSFPGQASPRNDPAPPAMSAAGIAASVAPDAKAIGASARNSLYFSDNDATLDEGSASVLRQLAEHLRKNPKRRVVLKAYLDDRGSRSYSLAIVQKRLDAVTAALREKGVPRSRIRQIMLGQRGNKLTCETPLCLGRRNSIELQYR